MTMVRGPVYLDHHSTTPVDRRVVEAMLPFFTEHFGNAASVHRFGRRALEAVEEARGQVAELIGAEARTLVFTSGATESNNLALKGLAALARSHGNHVVTVQTEHRAVLDPCRRLGREGFDVTFLPVDCHGVVDPEQVRAAITPRTFLVSVMLANNEVGTLAPLAEIGRICKQKGVILHSDATQAVGKIDVDVEALQVDLLSFSAHKLYGPKGVGALYVRRRAPAVRLEPLFDGGGHERGLRSGTLPVPGIVGFGAACALCKAENPGEAQRLANLRHRLYLGLRNRIEHCSLNGHPEQRLPGNLNVSFEGVRGDALLMALRNVAVSSGSACTSANVEPSYVLRALGVPDELAHASLRFGLGRTTTEEEIDFAIGEVAQAVSTLRDLNPVLAFS